jgi:hypothetical protein
MLLFGECDCCGKGNRVLHQCVAYGTDNGGLRRMPIR